MRYVVLRQGIGAKFGRCDGMLCGASCEVQLAAVICGVDGIECKLTLRGGLILPLPLPVIEDMLVEVRGCRCLALESKRNTEANSSLHRRRIWRGCHMRRICGR